MLPTVTCRVVVAVLVLAVTVAGCLGDGDDADRERLGPDRPTTSEMFRQLEQRPVDLPTVDLRPGGIRERPAGDCVEDGGVPVVAIATRAFFGVGALAPYPHWQQGPVYALVGDAPRIVGLSLHPKVGQWYTVPTIWFSRPSYDGPILVRGGRLDAPGRLRFGPGVRPRMELRLPTGTWPPGDWPREAKGPPESWRATSIPTLIPAPGCYAYQVDGLGFSYILAFGAQSEL
jgi:hypothetical protein